MVLSPQWATVRAELYDANHKNNVDQEKSTQMLSFHIKFKNILQNHTISFSGNIDCYKCHMVEGGGRDQLKEGKGALADVAQWTEHGL